MDSELLQARLGRRYPSITVVDRTGSTNADLAALDAPDRTVLIAREQTAGQGRRGRDWSSPGGGLYLSVLYRPGISPDRVPWLTLLAGVALVRTAASFGVEARVKWPNDLLIGGAKAAGVLAEASAPGVVVLGIGLNVGPLPESVRPGPGGLPPTSLGVDVPVLDVAVTLLTELDALESAWRGDSGDPYPSGLLAEYRSCCATLGQEVRVELTDGVLVGTAVRLDQDGTLVVRDGSGREHTVSAGDVVHLRPSE
ncbi:biotin--[acetyl-CoA-carboxylase] ligase [Saccharothrix violaceirubra]|uniref:biotin--[biotin carboxyl-carrier protein] ligase n=1 Tax=Saccharothrix violaceirubra TaxID=413306 RepID=A0A7W7WTV7_9PSEU|nr:biotin--[acetyl-CoA-carboxylase] ligase [Saccharothrix violaceirubra]MBB4963122.1 BirA family biotin operon repressor/biotin-[acetyl-CoA-carboxylase] ligase [Saccharothrix violaceirubra]